MIVPAARVIRLGLVLTVALAVPAIALAAALRGGTGVVSVVVGLAIVVAFFSISKLAVGAVARRAPHHLLPAALGTYALKIGLLGGLLLAIQDTDTLDLPAFAWSIFVGVFVWMGAELWVATHTRVPFYDPQRPGAWDTSRRPPTLMTPDPDPDLDLNARTGNGADAARPGGSGVGENPGNGPGRPEGASPPQPRSGVTSGDGGGAAGRGGSLRGPRRPPGPAAPRGSTQHPGEAWNIFGTLAAGLGFWGAVGFGADRLLGFDGLFLPIGLAIGIGAAMYLVIYRLTRR